MRGPGRWTQDLGGPRSGRHRRHGQNAGQRAQRFDPCLPQIVGELLTEKDLECAQRWIACIFEVVRVDRTAESAERHPSRVVIRVAQQAHCRHDNVDEIALPIQRHLFGRQTPGLLGEALGQRAIVRAKAIMVASVEQGERSYRFRSAE